MDLHENLLFESMNHEPMNRDAASGPIRLVPRMTKAIGSRRPTSLMIVIAILILVSQCTIGCLANLSKAMVTDVHVGSPADKAGIRPGMKITSVEYSRVNASIDGSNDSSDG